MRNRPKKLTRYLRSDALLSSVDKSTKPLEELSEKKIGSKHFRRAISAYGLLLFCPLEYITRSFRADFVKRALDADQLIGSSTKAMDELCQPLTVLRVFLKLMFVHIGSVEQPVRCSPRSHWPVSLSFSRLRPSANLLSGL